MASLKVCGGFDAEIPPFILRMYRMLVLAARGHQDDPSSDLEPYKNWDDVHPRECKHRDVAADSHRFDRDQSDDSACYMHPVSRDPARWNNNDQAID